jgi:osmotically-inducible protein OsmY
MLNLSLASDLLAHILIFRFTGHQSHFPPFSYRSLFMRAPRTNAAEPLNSSVALQISRQFADSGRLRLRQLQVDEDRGSVVLRGEVPSFYLKQLAQSIAVSVQGVCAIENQLTVRSV